MNANSVESVLPNQEHGGNMKEFILERNRIIANIVESSFHSGKLCVIIKKRTPGKTYMNANNVESVFSKLDI